MKVAGMIFIIVSSGYVGFGIAASLKKRCRFIRQFLLSVQILESEICTRKTPLPQAFALTAAAGQGAAAFVFSRASKEMNQNRWIYPKLAMERSVEQTDGFFPGDPIKEILADMSAELGKYDQDSQKQTLEETKSRLEKLLHETEQECRIRSKTYRILGICMGISVAVLLI